MRNKFVKEQLAIHELYILNVLLVFVIIAVGLYVSNLFPPTKGSADLLLPFYQGGLQPKPVERQIFLSSTIVVFLFIVSFVALYPIQDNRLFRTVQAVYASLIPVFVGSILGVSLFGYYWWDFISLGLGAGSPSESLLYLVIIFIFTTSLMWCLTKFDPSLQLLFRIINKTKWWIFIGFSFVLLFAWRVISIYSITQSSKYFVHLDAIIYPLSQVVQGKTILVDLPSQYGLFPEILAPLFKLTGLTVLNFTLLMAFLQIISLFALFVVINKIIKHQVLILLGILSLIVITFGNLLYLCGVSLQDTVYQYWPIRFFWPAISVYLFYVFVQDKTIFKSLIISIISAIAIIWNADTGLFIFISYSVYLITRFITDFWFQRDRDKQIWQQKSFLVALILHFTTLLLIVIGFFAYLQTSSGKTLNYSWLYKYQSIFYLLGFGMMPIPTKLDPWVGVISIYIYGLISALFSWKKIPSNKSEMMFYLSILGVGLFVYYEGRSHPLNLLSVMWPAIVLGMIFSDAIVRSIKLKLIGFANIIPISAFFSLIVAVNIFLYYNIHRAFSDASNNLFGESSAASPVVLDELKFIKLHTTVGQSCIILALRQGIYYTEAGLSSPIIGPGLVEMLLKSDAISFEQQFKFAQPNCVFLGAAKSEFNPGFDYVSLFSNYVIKDKNKYGTLYFLQHK